MYTSIYILIGNERGRTPIYLASWMNHLRVVEVLLNGTNIDVNRGNTIDGSTPFSIASKEGHFKIMEKLIIHNKISEGKGWNSDSWTTYLTINEVEAETTASTATSLVTGTTSKRGKYLYTT